MKNLPLKLKQGIISLIITGLVFSGVFPARADLEEAQEEEPEVVAGETERGLEFVPGQLIVKLKEGKTLADLEVLNSRYNIASTEKVFKEVPTPEERLSRLKEDLTNLSTEHEGWYWQMDKESQEYRDYAAKLEERKEGLTKAIQALEELIVRQARQEAETG